MYPFGCSLSVKNQATVLLSSGPTAYPHNECVFAEYRHQNNGSLFVIGSWQLFSDEYFELEENHKIFQFILNQIGTNKNLKIKVDLNVR